MTLGTDIRREIYPYPEADYCRSVNFADIKNRLVFLDGLAWDSVPCSIKGAWFIRSKRFERDFPDLAYFAHIQKAIDKNFEFPQYYGRVEGACQEDKGDFVLTVTPSFIEIIADSDGIRDRVRDQLLKHKEELGNPTQ